MKRRFESRRIPCTHAFTVVELLLVLVIIGLILGLVGPAIFKQGDTAKQKAAQSQIKLYQQCVDSFYVDNDRYPESLDDLIKNPDLKTWKGPYVKGGVLKADPWSEPFHYETPGRDDRPYEIYSYGRDRAPGGEDADQDIYADTEL